MSNLHIAELGKNNQFSKDNQPGERGRKPGTRNRKTIALEWLSLPTTCINPATGAEISGITIEDALVLAQIQKALKGDTFAFNALMDAAHGKVTNKHDEIEPENRQITGITIISTLPDSMLQ